MTELSELNVDALFFSSPALSTTPFFRSRQYTTSILCGLFMTMEFQLQLLKMNIFRESLFMEYFIIKYCLR